MNYMIHLINVVKSSDVHETFTVKADSIYPHVTGLAPREQKSVPPPKSLRLTHNGS